MAAFALERLQERANDWVDKTRESLEMSGEEFEDIQLEAVVEPTEQIIRSYEGCVKGFALNSRDTGVIFVPPETVWFGPMAARVCCGPFH